MPDFIVQYYLVILIVVLFILFAIIGYLAESVKKKESGANSMTPGSGTQSAGTNIPTTEIAEAKPTVESVPQSEIIESTQPAETLEDNK